MSTVKTTRRLSGLVVAAFVIMGASAQAFATATGSAAVVGSVFSGIQSLFVGTVVPAVVLFFIAKIALVMATAWAGHLAATRKS